MTCERCSDKPAFLYFRGQNICAACLTAHPAQAPGALRHYTVEKPEWQKNSIIGAVPHRDDCECPKCKPSEWA